MAHANTNTYGTFSLGIRLKSRLNKLLGVSSIAYWPLGCKAQAISAVVGWGYRGRFARAKAFAEANGLQYLTLEDGWIRSIGLNGRWAQSLSIVIDDVGIYYDALRPSRLETLIAEADFDDGMLKQSRFLRRRIIDLKITKYNHAPPAPELPEGEKVLVVDQTYGDLSIKYGMANAESFNRMLEVALAEHPNADIYLKVHPQVVSGDRQGHFDLNALPERVHVIGMDMNPIGLIEQMDHVHVVTSQLGFEALMLSKPVTCHGMPFYAGWGATDDRAKCERRVVQRSVDQIFTAAYLQYSLYFNPLTGKACELEELLHFLELQLQVSAGRYFCIGFRRWKHYIIRAFLQGPAVELVFCRTLDDAKSKGLTGGDSVVVWSSQELGSLSEYCKNENIPLIRVEDGFIRSVGLGSDFIKPVSLVRDDCGIYYDPRRPSKLEHLLENCHYSEEDKNRARTVIDAVLGSRITKYNLAGSGTLDGLETGERLRILVPGQVEDDASVVCGGGAIQDNLSLLKAVREAYPDAYILFKPHPDVESGNRHRKSNVEALAAACDTYLSDVDILGCLDWADEVHTLTSLTGFEALMRGLAVTTYGAPFYAGWGLTRDCSPMPRRTRQLSLEELVYAVLVDYPSYYDWSTGNFVGIEIALDHLVKQRYSSSRRISSGIKLLDHSVIKVRQLANMIKYSQFIQAVKRK